MRPDELPFLQTISVFYSCHVLILRSSHLHFNSQNLSPGNCNIVHHRSHPSFILSSADTCSAFSSYPQNAYHLGTTQSKLSRISIVDPRSYPYLLAAIPHTIPFYLLTYEPNTCIPATQLASHWLVHLLLNYLGVVHGNESE